MCNARLRRNSQWVHVSNDRIVLFWSTLTECECSSEPVPMFLTSRVIVLRHNSRIRDRPTRDCCTLSQRQNGYSVVPEHPLGTIWAESGILDEPDILHSSYPAVSSQILFTTTTYGSLHVERITACQFFYTYT